MSREQEALWLDDLVSDGRSMYDESWAVRLVGGLDVGALEGAIGRIIARHEVLRSRLTELGGEPVQIVGPAGPVRLMHVSCAPADLPAELDRIVAEPLDLDDTPVRPWLIHVSADEFVLVVQLHHAVMDGWSTGILQRELTHFYQAGQADPAPLPMQAGDFALAQRAAGIDPADLAHWRGRVLGAPRSCTIAPDAPGPEELPHDVARRPLRIAAELGRAVRAASRGLRTTSFTLFAAAMAALLRQHGETDEVIFGTPVSLRGTAEVDGMIGYLSNLLPLRLAVTPDTSFRMLANAAKAEILGAMQHRTVPYSQLVRMARGTEARVRPLCDVIVVVNEMSWAPFSLPGVTATRVHLAPVKAKCALTVNLSAGHDGGYTGFCEYDSDVYRADTMDRVAGQFVTLLARGVAAPDEPIGTGAVSALR